MPQPLMLKAEVNQFYEDLEDLLELAHTKKDVLFNMRDWTAKVGSNRQVWPWRTK